MKTEGHNHTPLVFLFPRHPSVIAMLMEMRIYTAEQLGSANASHFSEMPGLRQLCEEVSRLYGEWRRANEWLAEQMISRAAMNAAALPMRPVQGEGGFPPIGNPGGGEAA